MSAASRQRRDVTRRDRDDEGATSVARDLLDQAIALLDRPSPATAGLWPRASALLARQALEVALKTYWSKVAPGVEESSTRAQILCLERYISAEAARRASDTWNGLSHACHHHPYELTPTREELESWLSGVEHALGQTERAFQ